MGSNESVDKFYIISLLKLQIYSKYFFSYIKYDFSSLNMHVRGINEKNVNDEGLKTWK